MKKMTMKVLLFVGILGLLAEWEKPEGLTLYDQQLQKPSNQNPQVQSYSSGPLKQHASQNHVQLQSSFQDPAYSAKQGSKAPCPIQVRYADGERERHGATEYKLFVGSLIKSGFDPRFSFPGTRPSLDHHVPFRGPPSNFCRTPSPQNIGPHFHAGNHGLGNQFPPRLGDMAVSSTPRTSQPVGNNKPLGDLAATTTALPAVTATFNWSVHKSPDGYMYYYNIVIGESKWEKPEELTLYEQHQKPSNQNPQVQSYSSGLLIQQAPQIQVKLQGHHQQQILNKSKQFQQAAQSLFQVPAYSAKQGIKVFLIFGILAVFADWLSLKYLEFKKKSPFANARSNFDINLVEWTGFIKEEDKAVHLDGNKLLFGGRSGKRKITRMPLRSHFYTYIKQYTIFRETILRAKADFEEDPFFTEVDCCVPHNFPNYLLRVQNQGQTRCCYAFVIVNCMYAYFFMRERKGIRGSVQELLDCLHRHYPPPGNKKVNLDNPPKEGYANSYVNAFEYIKKFGLSLHENYGWKGICGQCPFINGGIKGDRITIEEYVLLTNFEDIVNFLNEGYILTGGVELTKTFRRWRGDGVYSLQHYNNDSRVKSKKKMKLHSITLIGYHRSSGQPYFLAQNTYGKNLGHCGYIKISPSLVCSVYRVLGCELMNCRQGDGSTGEAGNIT